jgi:hypothetical protein
MSADQAELAVGVLKETKTRLEAELTFATAGLRVVFGPINPAQRSKGSWQQLVCDLASTEAKRRLEFGSPDLGVVEVELVGRTFELCADAPFKADADFEMGSDASSDAGSDASSDASDGASDGASSESDDESACIHVHAPATVAKPAVERLAALAGKPGRSREPCATAPAESQAHFVGATARGAALELTFEFFAASAAADFSGQATARAAVVIENGMEHPPAAWKKLAAASAGRRASDQPLVFSGAGARALTKLYVEGATFYWSVEVTDRGGEDYCGGGGNMPARHAADAIAAACAQVAAHARKRP